MIPPSLETASGKEVGLFTATGPTGNGKTTLMTLVACLLNHSDHKPDPLTDRIVFVDMSQIIVWGRKLDTELGEIVRGHQPLMDAGGFLPDDAAEPLFLTWREWALEHYANVETFLGAGFPRTKLQSEKFLAPFRRHAVVYTVASYLRVAKAILQRQRKTSTSERRSDDEGGELVVKRKWQEFLDHTEPAIQSLNGYALHLDYEDGLSCRLNQIFRHLEKLGLESPVKQSLVKRAIFRLKDPAHPIHQKIRAIEGPATA